MYKMGLMNWISTGKSAKLKTEDGEAGRLTQLPLRHQSEKKLFYTLIFILADTSGLLLWRSRALFSRKFIFPIEVKQVPIYVGGRWGYLPEKLSLLPPWCDLNTRILPVPNPQPWL